MQQCRKLLKEYRNGNYKVRIFSDGTKVRFSKDDEFCSKFPESIDLKITNQCDLRCPMCHEKSTPMGKEGDLNHPFLDTLVPGTELAIGGGNPLEHRDLIPFLQKMKRKGIICNITVNQVHLVKHKELIQKLINNKLIYGLGISVTKDLFIDEVIEFCAKNSNSVIHVIAGIINQKLIKKLSNNHLKILILGYKAKGRGKTYYPDSFDENMNYLKYGIMEISKGFDIVSFDNLAIIQLKMKNKVEDYESLYMGDDGEFTMYIDLVKKEFSVSSVSDFRFKLKEDIRDMFKKVKEITPIYHIEYYESTDEDEMLFATLKEDDSYTFFFDEEKREWVFSGLRLRDIIRPLERIDENLMAWLTLGKFADELYESMFGLRIYKEKERGVNPIEDLVNSLVEFAKDHYIVGFNDSTIKHLSAKDLEEAYHSGFYELIEKYYNDINSNDKYTFIKIEQKEDDYIVHLNDELFKDIEPNE